MRDPNNKIDIEVDNSSSKTIKFSSIPEYELKDYDFNDEKDYKKFVDAVERACRFSFEYRQFVYFLREYMHMNNCSLCKFVSNEETFKVKIHIHHEPLTLFDIVTTVINKRMALNEPISEDMVAKEVMYQHYMLRVGVIPLSETVHELVHNQFIFIPTDAVYGKYWEFVDIYEKYIDPTVIDTLSKIQELSKTYSMESTMDLLKTNLIYIDTDDAFGKTNLEDVKTNLQNVLKKL